MYMTCVINSEITKHILSNTKNSGRMDIYKKLLACKKKELSLVIFSTQEWDYKCDDDFIPCLAFSEKLDIFFKKYDINEVFICDHVSYNEGNISLNRIGIKYNLYTSDYIHDNKMYISYMFFTTPKNATIFKLLV